MKIIRNLLNRKISRQTYYITNLKGKIFSENLTKRQGLRKIKTLKMQYPKEKLSLEMELPIF